MSKLRLTIPGNICTGKLISFLAPCDSSDITCLLINGENYEIVDTTGNRITGIKGIWSCDSVVSVLLDTENNKAYVQNPVTKLLPYYTHLSMSEATTFNIPKKTTNGWNEYLIGGRFTNHTSDTRFSNYLTASGGTLYVSKPGIITLESTMTIQYGYNNCTEDPGAEYVLRIKMAGNTAIDIPGEGGTGVVVNGVWYQSVKFKVRDTRLYAPPGKEYEKLEISLRTSVSAASISTPDTITFTIGSSLHFYLQEFPIE